MQSGDDFAITSHSSMFYGGSSSSMHEHTPQQSLGDATAEANTAVDLDDRHALIEAGQVSLVFVNIHDGWAIAIAA